MGDEVRVAERLDEIAGIMLAEKKPPKKCELVRPLDARATDGIARNW
jgi:hypothetical protein